MALQGSLNGRPPRAEGKDCGFSHGNLCALCVSLVLLSAGCLIYLFFRDHIWFLEVFFGISHGLFKCPATENSLLLYWLIYSLPDALWYAALIIMHRMFNISGMTGVVYSITVLTTPFILEFAQLAGVLWGTFDIIDVITYIITLIITYLCLRKT